MPTWVFEANVQCCEGCRSKIRKKIIHLDGVTGFVIDLNKNPPQIVIIGTIDPNALIKILQKINKRVLNYYQEPEPEPESKPEPVLVPKPKPEPEAKKRESKLESETKNKPELKKESSNVEDSPPPGIYGGGSIYRGYYPPYYGPGYAYDQPPNFNLSRPSPPSPPPSNYTWGYHSVEENPTGCVIA